MATDDDDEDDAADDDDDCDSAAFYAPVDPQAESPAPRGSLVTGPVSQTADWSVLRPRRGCALKGFNAALGPVEQSEDCVNGGRENMIDLCLEG